MSLLHRRQKHLKSGQATRRHRLWEGDKGIEGWRIGREYPPSPANYGIWGSILSIPKASAAYALLPTNNHLPFCQLFRSACEPSSPSRQSRPNIACYSESVVYHFILNFTVNGVNCDMTTHNYASLTNFGTVWGLTSTNPFNRHTQVWHNCELH